MIRAAAYARYSSDNQRDESIDAQLRAIHKFANENGYQIVSEYIDRAKTGTNDRREEFQRMIRDSDDGDFEVVIVHKLDRFARKRYDSAIYRKALEENGVKLVSVLEQFTDSPEGIIFVGMSEAMSEYYSANLSREVKKGQYENAIACKHTGGFAPLGFRVNADLKYEINEEEAVHVRFIFQSILSGMNYSQIIRNLIAVASGHGAAGSSEGIPCMRYFATRSTRACTFTDGALCLTNSGNAITMLTAPVTILSASRAEFRR